MALLKSIVPERLVEMVRASVSLDTKRCIEAKNSRNFTVSATTLHNLRTINYSLYSDHHFCHVHKMAPLQGSWTPL